MIGVDAIVVARVRIFIVSVDTAWTHEGLVYVLEWQDAEVHVEFYNRGDFAGFKFPNTLNFTMAVRCSVIAHTRTRHKTHVHTHTYAHTHTHPV